VRFPSIFQRIAVTSGILRRLIRDGFPLPLLILPITYCLLTKGLRFRKEANRSCEDHATQTDGTLEAPTAIQLLAALESQFGRFKTHFFLTARLILISEWARSLFVGNRIPAVKAKGSIAGYGTVRGRQGGLILSELVGTVTCRARGLPRRSAACIDTNLHRRMFREDNLCSARHEVVVNRPACPKCAHCNS
jgi:hypothetical protein